MRKLLLLPLLLAAACDGGPGPTDDAQLTAAEAAELNRAVFGIVAGMARAGGPDVLFNAAPMALQNSITVPIQETQPCTPSGSMGISGTVTMAFDDVGGNTTFDAQISAKPAACAHRLESGQLITMSGDPDIDVHLTAAAGPEGITALRVEEEGAFTWTRGGTSGRCAVDVSALLNAATQMVGVTGTFCGFPVSESFPVEQ